MKGDGETMKTPRHAGGRPKVALAQISRLLVALESALAITDEAPPLTRAQRQYDAAAAAIYPRPTPLDAPATPEAIDAQTIALRRYAEGLRIRRVIAEIRPVGDPHDLLAYLATADDAPLWAREAIDLATPSPTLPLTPARIYAVARVLDAYRRHAGATIDDGPSGATDAVALLAYLAAPRIAPTRDRWEARLAYLEKRLRTIRSGHLVGSGAAENDATGEALGEAIEVVLHRSRRPPEDPLAWAITLAMRVGILTPSDLVAAPRLDESRLLAEVVATLGGERLDPDAEARLFEEIVHRTEVETALHFPARHYTAPKAPRERVKHLIDERLQLLEEAATDGAPPLPVDFVARCERLRAHLFDGDDATASMPGVRLALLSDTLLLVDPGDAAALEADLGIEAARDAREEVGLFEDDGNF